MPGATEDMTSNGRGSQQARSSAINWGAVAGLLLVALLVLAFLYGGNGPSTFERSTPSPLKERGVIWHVFVERPIPLVVVEPAVEVFADLVFDIFGIYTYGTMYELVRNDTRTNYSDMSIFRDSYASFTPPARGPVEIPIYILTGYGWREGKGAIPAWASSPPTPQYFERLEDVTLGFTLFRSADMPDLPLLGSNSGGVLATFLHEFGHNLGLKDLYPDGAVKGCESLPVVMAGNAAPPHDFIPHDLPPRYAGLIQNRTTRISPGLDGDEPLAIVGVEETYWANNTLRFLNYNTVIDQSDRAAMRNAHETAYRFDNLREAWTREEAAHIGMRGDFPYSCPQEFQR